MQRQNPNTPAQKRCGSCMFRTLDSGLYTSLIFVGLCFL